MVASPEALTVQNEIRTAEITRKIGDRAGRVLQDAAVRVARDLAVGVGPETTFALQQQLASIQSRLLQAGVQSYDQFLNDLVKQIKPFTRMSRRQLKAMLQEALAEGVLTAGQEAAAAGMTIPPVPGAILLSEQALITASRMGGLELAIEGSKRRTYSLGREYARAFMQPNGESISSAIKKQAQELADKFERSVRQAVLTGQTTQDLQRDLIGKTKRGGKPQGQIARNIQNVKSIAQTGAQAVANATNYDTLMANEAVKILEFVATLDEITSSLCRSLDGRKYKKEDCPRPPLHFWCRSTIVAFFPGEEGSGRSMTVGIEDSDGRIKFVGAYGQAAKNGMTDQQRALVKRNTDSGDITYKDWLKAQPAGVQDRIVGKKRGRMFRETGSLASTNPPSVKRQIEAVEAAAKQK